MADITMCHGEANGLICKKRGICYRFTATPNEDWQSYAHPPLKLDPVGNQRCEQFWFEGEDD